MNDFTKEELQDLHYYTIRYNEMGGFCQPIELLNKIQSMIDNHPGSQESKCPHGITERNCPNCFEANNE